MLTILQATATQRVKKNLNKWITTPPPHPPPASRSKMVEMMVRVIWRQYPPGFVWLVFGSALGSLYISKLANVRVVGGGSGFTWWVVGGGSGFTWGPCVMTTQLPKLRLQTDNLEKTLIPILPKYAIGLMLGWREDGLYIGPLAWG